MQASRRQGHAGFFSVASAFGSARCAVALGFFGCPNEVRSMFLSAAICSIRATSLVRVAKVLGPAGLSAMRL